jgi:hypothetical protein
MLHYELVFTRGQFTSNFMFTISYLVSDREITRPSFLSMESSPRYQFQFVPIVMQLPATSISSSLLEYHALTQSPTTLCSIVISISMGADWYQPADGYACTHSPLYEMLNRRDTTIIYFKICCIYTTYCNCQYEIREIAIRPDF